MTATIMLVGCPSCGKRVSDRAPSCPFCGAALPTVVNDRDATPGRGMTGTRLVVEPHELTTAPPPPPQGGLREPRSAALLGPFERARPLDGEGRTFLAFSPTTETAAVIKLVTGETDRHAALAWSSLASHPAVVRAAGLTAVADGLAHHEAVLGHAPDGGWWVLGLRRPADAEALRGVPMSTPTTGRDTQAALLAGGLSVGEAAPLRDVDTVADAHAVAAAAPHGHFAAAWAARPEARP